MNTLTILALLINLEYVEFFCSLLLLITLLTYYLFLFSFLLAHTVNFTQNIDKTLIAV